MRVYHPTGKGRVVPAKPLQAKNTIPLAPQTTCPVGGKRRREEAHRSHNKRGPVRRPTLKYVVVGGLTTDPATGVTSRVTGLDLAERHGLNPEECVLCDDQYEALYNTAGLDLGHCTLVTTRSVGVPRAVG